jgi:hypothetical protein
VTDADDLARAQPHDIDAERAVLGLALYDREQIPAARAHLNGGSEFYRPVHGELWRVLCRQYDADQPTDPTIVRPIAMAEPTLAKVMREDPTWLADFMSAFGTMDARPYAKIVADHHRSRRWIETGNRIVQMGHQADPEAIDYLAADQLERMVDEAMHRAVVSSWAPVDLAEIRATDRPRPEPTVLTTTSGQSLLYPASVHSISGEPTAGKSWVALVGIAQQVELGRPSAYIDFEDRPETLVARLDDMGCDPDAVDALVRYVRPEQALNPEHANVLDQAVRGCSLVIIDGVTEAMTMHGLDLSSNPDVAQWLEMLPRRIANTGAAVLQVDHVVKDSEARGRYAIGGQHKLAGIVGSYTMLVGKPWSPNTLDRETGLWRPGKGGLGKVVVAKDRHGAVGTVGVTVAELHIAPATGTGTRLDWSFTPPTNETTDDSGYTEKRYTGYMDKISRLLEGHPQGLSQKDVFAAVRGKDTYKQAAIADLLKSGCIRLERQGNAMMHISVAPFREDA